MLTVQRWYPDTCGCSFNQAFDDGLPDDVLPATERSRPYDGHKASEVIYVTRLDAEAIKQQRRDRIKQVTETLKAKYKLGLLTIDDVFDAMHTRNSLERGLRAFDKDEIEAAAKAGLEPKVFWARFTSKRRKELHDFLAGRDVAKPSSGITDTPVEAPVLCAVHEEFAPTEAYEIVLAENQKKNRIIEPIAIEV